MIDPATNKEYDMSKLLIQNILDDLESYAFIAILVAAPALCLFLGPIDAAHGFLGRFKKSRAA